jgi:N6-adenosine-specific RNA methylase IME4
MWPFGELVPHKYNVVLVDPPWRFVAYSAMGEKKSPSRHYHCMSADELRALPVFDLAAKDCALVMWAYWPLLPLALELAVAWGFKFKSGGTWAKRSKTGRKWAFSTGYLFRGACEPFVVATLGRPEIGSRSERNLIVAPVREHSRKPEAMHAALERLFPGAKRCELFACQRRDGWDGWGDELDKYDAEGRKP